MKNLLITVFAIASLLSTSALAADKRKTLKCDSNTSKAETDKVVELVKNAHFWYGPKSKCVKQWNYCYGMYKIDSNFVANSTEYYACKEIKDKIDDYLVSNNGECKDRGSEAYTAARTQYFQELSRKRTAEYKANYTKYKKYVDEWDHICDKYDECSESRKLYKKKQTEITQKYAGLRQRKTYIKDSRYLDIRGKFMTSKCCAGSSCNYL